MDRRIRQYSLQKTYVGRRIPYILDDGEKDYHEIVLWEARDAESLKFIPEVIKSEVLQAYQDYREKFNCSFDMTITNSHEVLTVDLNILVMNYLLARNPFAKIKRAWLDYDSFGYKACYLSESDEENGSYLVTHNKEKAISILLSV